jgi:hypothetical protein
LEDDPSRDWYGVRRLASSWAGIPADSRWY